MTSLPHPTTLLGRLDAWASRAPDAPAAVQGATTWSVRTLLRESARVAGAMHALGVRAGDRVAWWGAPSLDFAAVLCATWKLDATYLGIDPRYTADEVVATLRRAAPRLVLIGADFEPDAPSVAAAQSVTTLRTMASLDGMPGPHMEHPLRHEGAEAPALLVFTTGSTGTPKGALISHRAVAAASHHQAVATASEARSTIHALPCNHIGGLVNVTTASWWGQQCLLMVPRFSPVAIAEVLRTHAAVRLPGVPTLFRRCLDEPAFRRAAPGRLVHALSGGAAMSPDVYGGLQTLGVPVQGMYGQTEMSGSVCFTPFPASAAEACEGIGRAHAGVELRVASALADTDTIGGELQVRGEQLFDGYLDDARATAEAFTSGGWLRSGDLARVSPDGTVQLTGRLKEVINTGGYKVMPGEVERVLLAHPSVACAAVVGRPHATYGEVVYAYVSGHDAQPLEVGLLFAWCADRLASYKLPRAIVSLPQLPLLGVGKVDKRTLAAWAAGRTDV